MEHLIIFFINHPALVKYIVRPVFKLIFKRIRKSIAKLLLNCLLSHIAVQPNFNVSIQLTFHFDYQNQKLVFDSCHLYIKLNFFF